VSAAPADDLAALEQRWRDTGDRADEGALLLARVRAGLLDRSRLELAAFCAHEGARRALDVREWPPDLGETLAGLARWGPAAVDAAARALAQAELDLGNVDARTQLRHVRAALIELALGP
jgi:hypothetical protein